MSTYLPSISPTVLETINPGGPPPSGVVFVLVAMENQDYGSVIGNSNAPFINSLLSQGATLPNYQGSLGGDSEPNYVALVSGQTFGSSDGQRNLGDCSTPERLRRTIPTRVLCW